MLILDDNDTRNALPFPGLIAALRAMFISGCAAPPRHHHDVQVPGEPNGTLLLMPAWLPGRYMGLKQVSVFPGNAARGLPSIFGSYLLSSAVTGELLAIIDGGELTARRTAAASALAASCLARKDASVMLMTGTGRLSANLIEAHKSVLPLRKVFVWGRDPDKAAAIARHAETLGLEAIATGDLEAAARQADLISCATLSTQPLIHGDWLKPGAHLDLVGAFKPTMRETDDRCVSRATCFVDTRAGALSEGGDVVQAIAAGVITADSIAADLAELARGDHPGRTDEGEITLFKSVGASLEDLAGAIFAFEQTNREASDEL
ncbi:MAG: ornithine cyclodeaminase family protein [Rhizobiaceae bacterium]|nr:ornithine cyclodeaminase family protein [Rhizobiaceae bacterium]